MMTIDYYNWAKSQPGFQGFTPILGGAGEEPKWSSGYGPGSPTYKPYGGDQNPTPPGSFNPFPPARPASGPAPTPMQGPYNKGQSPLGRFSGRPWMMQGGPFAPRPYYGGQANPLQPFMTPNTFGQPMGGWGGGANPMMGGMPKDNATAKQWYQQNPSKEWWKSA